MQQLDHESARGAVSRVCCVGVGRGCSFTFILLDDPADLLEARLQLATDAVCHGVDIVEQLALLFEFAAHVVGLLSQIADGAEDTVKGLVLLVHHLNLTLLLKGSIVVLVLERVGIGQCVAVGSPLGVACVLDRLLQRLAHIVDLTADILDQAPPAFDLVDLQAEAIWVDFDGLDALGEISKVLAEIRKGLLELAAGLSELGAGG